MAEVLKVKIFNSYGYRLTDQYEEAVNKWLAENDGLEIKQIKQSSALVMTSQGVRHAITISIWY